MHIPAYARPRERHCSGSGRKRAGSRQLTSAEQVVLPSAEEVPEWSEHTAALLRNLTPLQNAFAQWMASGLSASEAYRRAKRKAHFGPNTRNNAAQLSRNPRVRAAIDAALMDAHVGARMDRAWMLAVLKEQIDEARLSGDHRRVAAIPRLLRLLAELQGELPRRPAEAEANDADQRSDIRIRIQQIIAEAKGVDGRQNTPAVITVPAEQRQTVPQSIGR
jgi:hypothetical protein